MKKHQECKKNEKGSLTVEALLFLIPFMCAFLTIINAARFVQSEMLIHHAITQTAKQVSTYSYLLTITDISKEIQETHKKSKDFQTDTENAANSVSDFLGALGAVGGGDPIGETTQVINTAKNAEETLTDYFSDPEAILTGVLAGIQSKGEDLVLCAIIGGISRNNINVAVSKVSDDTDEYLKNIGIVDGLQGLDFSQSRWMSNTEGKGNIDIVVTYKLKNLLFPQFDFGELEFCQCASTLIW